MTDLESEIQSLIVKNGYVYLEITAPSIPKPVGYKKEYPCFYPCEVRCKFNAILYSDEISLTLKHKHVTVNLKKEDIKISEDQETKLDRYIINTDINNIIEVLAKGTPWAKILYGETGGFKDMKKVEWKIAYVEDIKKPKKASMASLQTEGIKEEESKGYRLITTDKQTIYYEENCIILIPSVMDQFNWEYREVESEEVEISENEEPA